MQNRKVKSAAKLAGNTLSEPNRAKVTLSQFHYEILGQAGDETKKLVFLHGLLGFAGNWRRVTKSFEHDHQILIFDQRGHGRSFKPEASFRPEDFANDLYDILEELRWQKISLVGHSMGGRNAMNFAYRFPQKVERLVLEDIGPDANQTSLAKFEKMFTDIPTPFKDKLTAKQFFLNDYPDRVMGSYLYTNIAEISPGVFDWRFSKTAVLEAVREGRARDRWEEAAGLQVPTLVIRGANSEDLPREVFQKMLVINPQIQGIEIADSGHWVHFDEPEKFIAALENFLRSPR